MLHYFFVCIRLSVAFGSVIVSVFHLHRQQKRFVCVGESLQRPHRRSGRRSCLFASI